MVVTPIQIMVFMLVLARVAGLFISAPIISAKSVPAFVKIGLAIWLAVILWFVVPLPYGVPDSPALFLMALVIEVFVGYTIGFISNLIIQSIQAAGDMADVQMGLSVANVLSPTTGLMTSVVGSLTFYIAMVVFFIVDGHHMIFAALHQSFRALPVTGALNFSGGVFVLQIIELIKFFWVTAIRLAAPSLLLIFLSDFSFGIVSRVAPQVNVFMLGFQVKPGLGLLGIMLVLPILTKQISGLIGSIGTELGRTFIVLK
ncbi:flagellar biosynthetic protein FliR [Candidatus Margulisiibacteriota bacterium]